MTRTHAGLAPGLALALALFLALSACKERAKIHEDEDLKTVAAADRKLMKRERKLLQRRGSLQRERTRLRDKRAALASKRATLQADDDKGRAELEQEESKLAKLEASLVQQEIGVNKKLQALLTEKSNLVEKLSADSKNATAREMLVGRREYSLSLREKDLARREAELARREKALAAREQALAARQANICPGRGAVQVVQAPASSGGGGSYTRKDVEPVFRAALSAMRKKGILTADLPPGVDRLVTETRHGVSKGEYTRAKYAADQLLATVRKMKIDRAFIGAKIGRLSKVIRRTSLAGERRRKVNSLFQQATANYGDGRFIAANSKLNRIYGLLR